MEKEFIPYEQALALKELGFDEPCLYNYSEVYGFIENMNGLKHSDGNNRFISAPLYQQVFRWFREKYDIYAWIKREYTIDHVLYYRYTCEKSIESPPNYTRSWATLKEYNTYEEAELGCLKKLIEIVKDER